MFLRASDQNTANLITLAQEGIPRDLAPFARICDMGCGDGSLTRIIAENLGVIDVDGFDVNESLAPDLAKLGIKWRALNFNTNLKVESDSYDLVLSNQVIEHLYDTDVFLSECFRVTKPGGSFIVSTENPASWHNVLSLVMGWQPFSLTNVSALSYGVGNPLALHRGEGDLPFPMQHHRLFTPRALSELLELHRFVSVRVLGAGYYPLHSKFGLVDPTHAHFIALSARKP